VEEKESRGGVGGGKYHLTKRTIKHNKHFGTTRLKNPHQEAHPYELVREKEASNKKKEKERALTATVGPGK